MTKINLPYSECNRNGTGNIFNLIMRMTVVLHNDESVQEDHMVEYAFICNSINRTPLYSKP